MRSQFLDQNYIREIVIIPEAWLTNVRGFDALQQVGRLHSLDVMALVSYDQISIAEDRTSSFLYWTIVGAYVVKGSQNDVRTFVDTAVFDLNTRKLLFRAPGLNEITSNTTLIRSVEKMREAREKSIEQAVGDMTSNLAKELDRFESRIKEDGSVLIAQRDGSKGSGSFDPWILLLLLGGLLLRRRSS